MVKLSLSTLNQDECLTDADEKTRRQLEVEKADFEQALTLMGSSKDTVIQSLAPPQTTRPLPKTVRDLGYLAHSIHDEVKACVELHYFNFLVKDIICMQAELLPSDQLKSISETLRVLISKKQTEERRD